MTERKTRKKLITRLAVFAALIATVLTTFLSGGASTQVLADSCITLLDKDINTNFQQYLNSDVVHQLPASIKEDQIISLIVQTKQIPLLDRYHASGSNLSFGEYARSSEADAVRQSIAKEKASLLTMLDELGVAYTTGADYAALVSGFEISITARDFEAVSTAFAGHANTFISEAYHKAETQVVENAVDVTDAGIFDASDFGYDGTGIVVAVLDTGIDYDHSAFSVDNFTADRSKLGLTYNEVAALMDQTKASTLVPGLTAADVYINEKIPYAFDYADNDSDAYPINSDHGTHVSGIIAGNDDEITGVAPNAQLVEMKIFSDVYDTALASWILNAVEDCVILGVDVINMSIGTSAGFARETDKEFISGVYQKIKEQGISLVVAASNSFNSTYGSEKNGNLGLTTNPDSGTVGSPSTYDSALSVASVSGTKTPYLLHNGKVVYFTESVDRISEEKEFVKELLGNDKDSLDIEYVLIPGAGRSADYTGMDVTGKVVLVARGSTTFEEKAAVAQAKGAAGLIIYNNVSGEIRMNVGDATIPVCSISQDDGKALAEAGSGTITVSVSQAAGPFMSDFSSWGPTPSLEIKPEITAHGGSIYSAVPGQSYDRISGTSMACPNISGLTALMRQYVKENFPEIADNNPAVTTMVNRLMMSTANILLNKNGNPYAVRKQGAGLADLNNCANATAYIITYGADGKEMNKTKLELGDDAARKGVYTMSFSIVNFGTTSLSYDLSAYVMTEGVSDTKTSHGDTTVSEEAYILSGATFAITNSSNATVSDRNVTVAAGQTASLTVTVTLGDADKKYLDDSFKNGMYVEGFIVLNAADETVVDMSIPYLGFYGDWTVAPLFDLDYYQTNKDELNLGLDPEDKTMADAYATRPVGGIYNDYVSYLGSYYFVQNPNDTPIPASKEHIALTNQTDGINALRYVWAGMLRSAAEIDITITEDSTGKVVFQKTETDIRKSYGDGGSIYPSNIEIEFSAIEHNLKNNSRYTVTLDAKLDYGDGGTDTNLNNTFSFPLYIDFQAPAITGCTFYTEYDKSAEEMRYFAKMDVYDNHYSMALEVGYVGYDADGNYTLNAFERYLTPVYSEFNNTSEVIYELTDYINQIRKGSANRNTFTVACYDYALNCATYEIALPDDFLDIAFGEESLTLSPNQVIDLEPLVYPETEWSALMEYFCTSPASGEVARVVNNKLVAVAPGNCVVIARDPVTKKQATVKLKVLSEGDDGYQRFDKPVLDTFELTGYYTNKAFDFLNTEDQDIGTTGNIRKFTNGNYVLSMYPSESVTLEYILDAYFPKNTQVVFSSSNDNIVKVDKNGTITAVAEGYGSITVQVTMDGKNTYYSKSITVTVKDPYVTNGPTLVNYYGLGGDVLIPENLHITDIGNFAFSNYTYIEKTPDEFNFDESASTKIWYIGENTITTVVVPEGVKSIGDYAFAGLTNLTTVVLPSTLERIDQGAFYGCEKLTTVKGLEHVKFINQSAFENCNLSGTISLDNTVCVADRAFAGNKNLKNVVLSAVTRSVGGYAFYCCKALESVTVNAANVKIGPYVFAGCASLKEISMNTNVVSIGAFYGCENLTTVHLGADLEQISEYAFGKTAVSALTIDSASFKLSTDGNYVTNAAGDTLVLVLPSFSGEFSLDDPAITTVGVGAFASNNQLTAVNMPHVTKVDAYAFAECAKLRTVTLGKLTTVGNYAFFDSGLKAHPDLSAVAVIGDYAFAGTDLTSVTIADGTNVGISSFKDCGRLESVTIGDNVTLGEGAFYLNSNENYNSSYFTEDGERFYYYYYTSPLHSLTIGSNAIIGDYAFHGAAELESVSLGDNATIGDYAFYNASGLKSIDLSKVVSIGAYAFSGDLLTMGADSFFESIAVDENGFYLYSYHAPSFVQITLDSVASVGEFAFSFCPELETVHMGEKLTVISQGVFQGCSALKNVNLGSVTEIGSNAFEETALTVLDLSSVSVIGDFAFLNLPELTEVIFNGNGVTLGEGAFSYCSALESLLGEEAITVIGDYGFAYTAVTDTDLTGATHIGKHAFIKESMTDFTVKLGSGLVSLGDNPFAMCHIPSFTQDTATNFNGKDYTTTVYTFPISDTVQVIDGSLYQAVPNGLELVTFAGTSDITTVAENTVRISDMAFAGSAVRSVTLPHTVAALGHKAFFGCEKLTMVIFQSYNAPSLEEEYDYNYFLSGDHIPATGKYDFYDTDGVTIITKEGIGIVPYFMWNGDYTPTNVYYGASFVNYIGHYDPDLILVRPANGKNYGSFIMDRYFAVTVDGAAAADKLTLAAINAIKALPDTVRLSDKPLVEAARAAYDLISTLEQKALVTNYSKLTQAEKRIADLEYLDADTPPAETPPTVVPPAKVPQKTGNPVLVILICVICLPALILVTHTLVRAKLDEISVVESFRALLPRRKKQTQPETADNAGDSKEARDSE